MSNTVKYIVIAVVIGAVAYFGYKYFTKDAAPAAPATK